MKFYLNAFAFVLLFFISTVKSAKKECKDKSGSERCARYLKFYNSIGMSLCGGTMESQCEVTCKLCKPKPKCEMSTYGCCWDRKTPAKGHRGEGCPYCRDRKRSVCKRVIARILSSGRITKKQACSYGWSRRNCPQTCGMCALPAMAYRRCVDSIYGCCWNYTPAYGLNGQGCDECEDTYPHTCGQFNYYCNKEGINEYFMKEHCPLTCGRCTKGQLLLDPYGKRHKK